MTEELVMMMMMVVVIVVVVMMTVVVMVVVVIMMVVVMVVVVVMMMVVVVMMMMMTMVVVVVMVVMKMMMMMTMTMMMIGSDAMRCCRCVCQLLNEVRQPLSDIIELHCRTVMESSHRAAADTGDFLPTLTAAIVTDVTHAIHQVCSILLTDLHLGYHIR